jgi:DNA repair protein SbcD/Mre11
VHLLGINGKWEITTFSKQAQTIQFVGWSFPSQYVAEDPLSTFTEITLDPNHITIGLLHGDLDNAESRYAPLQLSTLSRNTVKAWILGHIHKPAEIRKLNPSIWYPGSPQAMSSKEQGIHGPLLITIENTDITVRTVPLSPVRYERLSIDLTGVETEADLRDKLISGIVEDAGMKNKDLAEVTYLVYDIYLVGKCSKIKDVEAWANLIVKDYSQQTESGTTILVRNTSSSLQPFVQNLKELSSQESPAGILAQSILALEQGQTTPFLDELLIQWKHKQHAVSTSIVYQPVNTPGRSVDNAEPDAKEYILHECNRLLGELMTQQSKTA